MVLTQMITEIYKDFVTLTYFQIAINLQLKLLPMPTHATENSYYLSPSQSPYSFVEDNHYGILR
jgi:hypothetical protein